MYDEPIKGGSIEWYHIVIPLFFFFLLWGIHLYVNVLPVIQGLEPIPEIYKTDIYNIWGIVGAVVMADVMILLIFHMAKLDKEDETVD
jgi:hypothetical protein